jgi:hydroxymethylpyrimidine pyrophosphatase-like HAD family hydrolase
MKLVLFDVDGTLIDTDYNLTVPDEEFLAVIREAQDHEVMIGLCSDSATITLMQWSSRLALNGPIVAERGATVSTVDETWVLDPLKTAWFSDLRAAFVVRLMAEFPESTIMVGDATAFVKDRPSKALTEQIIAVNGFRTSSFSFFARQLNTDRTKMIPDVDRLEVAAEIVREIVSELGRDGDLLTWDFNVTSGILIVHSMDTSKGRGVASLIDRLKPELTVMVGDGPSDYLGIGEVIQCAVANADPRYKQKADYVARESLTRGAIECLLNYCR